MRATLLLSTLAMAWAFACATPPAPTRYERGTLARPPPAQQRPGVGLHTYEPHPEVVPQVQPQPKQAPVPHTPQTRREDTIWSGDAPQASTRRAPDLLDVVFPLPDGVAPEHVPALAECGNVYGAIFGRMTSILEQTMRLDPKDRACFLDALLGDCLYRANAAKDGSVPPSVLRRIDARFNECYPRFGEYSTIIREVEAARKRDIKGKKGDH